MNISIFINKNKKEKKNINGLEIKINPLLEDIYQNSPGVADLKMEISSYSLYGCRAIAIFRMINHLLLTNKLIDKNIPIKELDRIVDSGGEFKDAWSDNVVTPLYDVLNSLRVIEKINDIYNTELKYKLIKNNQYNDQIKMEIYNYIKNNIALCIKLPHLVNSNLFHFVNVESCILDKDNLYVKIKETYNNYNGYDKYYIDWKKPFYYEIIYL